MQGLTRDVRDDEIQTYQEHGVVKLAGILSMEWVDLLAQALDDVFYKQAEQMPMFYDSTGFAQQMASEGLSTLGNTGADTNAKRGRFLTAIGAADVNQDIRKLALESPLGYVAGRLFGAQKVNFYDDQLLTKEPGSKEYTAFHTDEPYYHLRGDQVCGMWISPDVVTAQNGAMQYVRGSHSWPSFFKPNAFVSQASLDSLGMAEADETQVPLPDIEGNRSDYDIVTYPSEPGDVIVHHSRLVHGSGPNLSPEHLRRAASLRYAGDDVTYWFHKSAPPQPHHTHNLKDGDPIDSEQFPIVWRATA